MGYNVIVGGVHLLLLEDDEASQSHEQQQDDADDWSDHDLQHIGVPACSQTQKQ